MQRSSDRILTTHTGSLPRAHDLTTTLEALDSGRMPDPAALERNSSVNWAVGSICSSIQICSASYSVSRERIWLSSLRTSAIVQILSGDSPTCRGSPRSVVFST